MANVVIPAMINAGFFENRRPQPVAEIGSANYVTLFAGEDEIVCLSCSFCKGNPLPISLFLDHQRWQNYSSSNPA